MLGQWTDFSIILGLFWTLDFRLKAQCACSTEVSQKIIY